MDLLSDFDTTHEISTKEVQGIMLIIKLDT